jgi:hypothetical protein
MDVSAANARISLLEAELGASRIAFDAATAAKVNAEKYAKSALAKAKKSRKGPGYCYKGAPLVGTGRG